MARRPRDPNQLAKLIVDIATGQVKDTMSEERRHPTLKRGRQGGLKGGKARASKLSAARRRAIALKAARSRWRKS